MVAGSTHTLGFAKRMRNSRAPLTNVVTLMTVGCETCGCHYAIEHPSGAEDHALAERQALWLADKFVWDHIQENKHLGSIPLPMLPAAAVAGSRSLGE